jgi:hypothetical protein
MTTSTATSCVKYLKHHGNSVSIQHSLTQETLHILHRVCFCDACDSANLLFLLTALSGCYLYGAGVCFL